MGDGQAWGVRGDRSTLQPEGCCFCFAYKPRPRFFKKLYVVPLFVILRIYTYMLCLAKRYAADPPSHERDSWL